jgi:heme-degrading monooxygenase HmoA
LTADETALVGEASIRLKRELHQPRGHRELGRLPFEVLLGHPASSWESEDAMRASDEQLSEMRDRGREILGGSMQVDEWQIAVMHSSHHGDCCRVNWLRGDLEAMTETFRVGILPRLEQMSGFCSASLFVNPSTGTGCATTAWESRAAMEASRSDAEHMRSQAAADAGGEVIDVREFELAYAHLHVPEMA